MKDLDGEKWRPIEAHPNYFVSNFGRVKHHQEAVLMKITAHHGFKRVELQKKKYAMELLLGSCFKGLKREGLGWAYRDDNSLNASLENLIFCQCALKSGQRNIHFERCPVRKAVILSKRNKMKLRVTAETREKIFSLVKEGLYDAEIARELGLHSSEVSRQTLRRPTKTKLWD